MERPASADLVVGAAPRILAALTEQAGAARLVFFAGLPGTGKSLLIHQLAHLAHARGRRVHLLQWDVARPVFEASGPGRRFPQERGVTHPVIRLAVGRWARQALVAWDRAHPGAEELLIGETPFVGHRLVELARVADDAAEPLLASDRTRFVVPVPSVDVRRHLEVERARRAVQPLHPRETEDAPPEVLRDLWLQLVTVAHRMGLPSVRPGPGGDVPYDPILYEEVYLRLLTRRHAQPMRVDALLPTAALSVYDLRVPTQDLVPTDAEAAKLVDDVATTDDDPAALARQIDEWWVV